MNACAISLKNLSSRWSDQLAPIGYYICGPLLTLVVISGVLGNVLCIKALLSIRRRTAIAINAYLIVLAVWDLCLVGSSFFLYNLVVLVNGYRPIYGEYVRSYPTFFTLANASHTASIWCIVSMAAERYFALCYPLRHRRATMDHSTRARRTLISISVVSILISIPKYFEVHFVECVDIDTGSEEVYVSISELRRDPAYSLIYIVIGGLVFHSLAPFLILIILSIRVMIEVRRGTILHRNISARRTQVEMVDNGTNADSSRPFNRASSSSRIGKSENSLNEVLPFAVVAKFFICHTLPTVLDIFERLVSEENFGGPLIDLLVDISNFLVVLNSSVNFLLYLVCSMHFRRRVVAIFKNFCLCGGQKKETYRFSTLSASDKKNDGECAAELLPADE